MVPKSPKSIKCPGYDILTWQVGLKFCNFCKHKSKHKCSILMGNKDILMKPVHKTDVLHFYHFLCNWNPSLNLFIIGITVYEALIQDMYERKSIYMAYIWSPAIYGHLHSHNTISKCCWGGSNGLTESKNSLSI